MLRRFWPIHVEPPAAPVDEDSLPSSHGHVFAQAKSIYPYLQPSHTASFDNIMHQTRRARARNFHIWPTCRYLHRHQEIIIRHGSTSSKVLGLSASCQYTMPTNRTHQRARAGNRRGRMTEMEGRCIQEERGHYFQPEQLCCSSKGSGRDFCYRAHMVAQEKQGPRRFGH